MRSDLDLATKTECMEAIRLTEGKDNRLDRFVRCGGVTKIAKVSAGWDPTIEAVNSSHCKHVLSSLKLTEQVMWLERALPEPGARVNVFLHHSLMPPGSHPETHETQHASTSPPARPHLVSSFLARQNQEAFRRSLEQEPSWNPGL